MKTITIITRTPEAVKDYFGFGCRQVERGTNKFGDHVIIAECPDQHADWNAMRLGSGLHGAQVMRNQAEFDRWKRDWEYRADQPLDPPGYAARVCQLEHEGLTTSDAQGVADVEFGLV